MRLVLPLLLAASLCPWASARAGRPCPRRPERQDRHRRHHRVSHHPDGHGPSPLRRPRSRQRWKARPRLYRDRARHLPRARHRHPEPLQHHLRRHGQEPRRRRHHQLSQRQTGRRNLLHRDRARSTLLASRPTTSPSRTPPATPVRPSPSPSAPTAPSSSTAASSAIRTPSSPTTAASTTSTPTSKAPSTSSSATPRPSSTAASSTSSPPASSPRSPEPAPTNPPATSSSTAASPPTSTALAGKHFFLGRPWRPYSRVVYIHTELPATLAPQGWDNWGKTINEQTAYYAEFGNSGPGANLTARVPWSHQLTSQQANQFLPQNFLRGQDHWDPIAEAKKLP